LYNQSLQVPVRLDVVHFIEFFPSHWRLFPRNQHRLGLEWRLFTDHWRHWLVWTCDLSTTEIL